MFSRRSREERERQAGRPRGVSTSGVCRLSMMKQRHACVVSWKIQTKKKNEEERARRDVHRNTSVSSCTECPGAYPAYTMFPFLFARSCVCVCVVLSSKCRYFQKKKEFSLLCFVALRL